MDAQTFAHMIESQYGITFSITNPRWGDSFEPHIVSLDSIVVPKDIRKSGIGSEVMTKWIAWADTNGYILSLTPSSDFGGNVSKLRPFYGRFGFVPNKGRQKDFRTRDAMIRYPTKKKLAYKDQIPGGLADKKKPSDFDPDELSMGVAVEMEHTNDRTKAREIAMDHLTEIPDYYTRLKKMEDKAEAVKKAMMSYNRRTFIGRQKMDLLKKTIRLAHSNPDLRDTLLPLIQEERMRLASGDLSSWKGTPGTYYVLTFKEGDKVYFYPTEKLKNGNIRGIKVEYDSASGKYLRPAQTSANRLDLQRWRSVSDSDLPEQAKDKIQSKL